MGFPYPAYLWTVVRRTALLWLLVRLLLVLLLWLATGDSAVAFHPSGTTRIVVIAVTVLLVWWDRRRARELLLHANLGASPAWFWIASLFTASVVDVAFQAVVEGV